ncbi:MAG TPA: PIN domain-containing protein [Mycobacterium sp.]|nr:PIN domain-containing protein [Mycobacterium sp.]
MTLVVDAAPLVAVADRRDRTKAAVETVLRDEPGDLIIAAPVTAEIDYLLGKRAGRDARLAFLADLAAERFRVADLEPSDYRVIADLERRYASLDVGLADLSTVVVAAKAGTRKVLTFDERHFRVLRPLNGGTFTLLPADA